MGSKTSKEKKSSVAANESTSATKTDTSTFYDDSKSKEATESAAIPDTSKMESSTTEVEPPNQEAQPTVNKNSEKSVESSKSVEATQNNECTPKAVEENESTTTEPVSKLEEPVVPKPEEQIVQKPEEPVAQKPEEPVTPKTVEETPKEAEATPESEKQLTAETVLPTFVPEVETKISQPELPTSPQIAENTATPKTESNEITAPKSQKIEETKPAENIVLESSVSTEKVGEPEQPKESPNEAVTVPPSSEAIIESVTESTNESETKPVPAETAEQPQSPATPEQPQAPNVPVKSTEQVMSTQPPTQEIKLENEEPNQEQTSGNTEVEVKPENQTCEQPATSAVNTENVSPTNECGKVNENSCDTQVNELQNAEAMKPKADEPFKAPESEVSPVESLLPTADTTVATN